MPTPTALIAGANKSIGLAIARRLGERGFSVWIGARDPARGEGAAAGLQEAGIDARALDVTGEGSVRAAADRLGREVGALDVPVNNAGIRRPVHSCEASLQREGPTFFRHLRDRS